MKNRVSLLAAFIVLVGGGLALGLVFGERNLGLAIGAAAFTALAVLWRRSGG